MSILWIISLNLQLNGYYFNQIITKPMHLTSSGLYKTISSAPVKPFKWTI